tara:strand:- start:11186 stop:11611 length:426 start_codon:yes stop_codon:yes gene_type:complete
MFKYIVLILFILLLASAAANKYLYDSHQEYVKETSATMAAMEAANALQTEAINRLEAQREEDQRNLLEMSSELGKVNEELNTATNRLDAYKNREDTVLARPGLIERRANAGTQRVFEELRCITGGGTCRDTTVPPSETVTP